MTLIAVIPIPTFDVKNMNGLAVIFLRKILLILFRILFRLSFKQISMNL